MDYNWKQNPADDRPEAGRAGPSGPPGTAPVRGLSRRRFGLLTLLGLAAAAPAVFAAEPGRPTLSRADAISFLLLNCVYYGTWPDESSPTKTKRLKLGVLGRDPLGKSLREAADKACGSWFKDGVVDIVHSDRPQDLAGCHAVFVGSLPAGGMAAMQAEWAKKPILLLGDLPNFAREGGTVGIRIEQERLLFELNLDQLAETGVELSAKLRQRASGFIRNGRPEPNAR